MPMPEYDLLNSLHGSGTLTIRSHNLPVVEEDGASAEIASLYTHFRSHFGRASIPGILKCFATHPPLLRHMMGLSEAMLFSDGALGRRDKELIATFISAHNSCAYCADSHGFFLRMNGGWPGLVEAAIGCNTDSSSLTPAQRALLVFAQKVNESSASITPADMDALREVGWNDLQIAETIHLAALFATFNRVVNAFGLPSQGLLAQQAMDDKNKEQA